MAPTSTPRPVIANHAYGPPHDNMIAGSVSFAMIETFGANNQSIKLLLLAAANGRGVQAHGAPSQSSLAAFLIGAGHRAYYGIGGWEERGHNFDDHWMPQFSLPLGAPHGDAEYDSASATWTRTFGKGVKVAFDCHARNKSTAGTISGPGGWCGSFD